MPSALAFIGGGLLKGFGKGLAQQDMETGKAMRERVHAELEHQRNLERDEINNNARVGLLTAKTKAEGLRLSTPFPGVGPGGDPGLFRVPKAGGPAVRVEGVTTPPKSTGITEAQRSKNQAIDFARAEWRRVVTENYGGDARAAINELFVLDGMGFMNPRDKAMGDLWKKAQTQKTGPDPDFSQFMTMFTPTAPTPPPPPEPGFFDSGGGAGRAVDAVTGLFGGGDAVAATPQGGQPLDPLPAIPRPGSGAGSPASSGRGAARLPLKLKARVDRNEIFTEAELREILRTQPEVYAALRAYLENRNSAGLGFVGP